MGDKTSIEWTRSDDGDAGATWNPIRGTAPDRWMCAKISDGCEWCYASRMNARFGGNEYPHVGGEAPSPWGTWLDKNMLEQPGHWKRPRRIFVCSMTDLFGEWVPDEWIRSVYGVMNAARQHTFLVLTKRPRRALEWYRSHAMTEENVRGAWSNVWMGTTIELDRFAWRATVLKQIPVSVHFVSAEPLLGPLPSLDLAGIDWLITGGESGGPEERRLVERCGWCGSGAPASECTHCGGQPWQPKPEALDWVRELRDRAGSAGVAFFHKQWGGVTPKSGGRLLDGREWSQFPQPREAVTR